MSYTMVVYSANDTTAQNLIGTWENAIEVLNGRSEDSDELRDWARRYVTNVVEQFTKEPTEGLSDWIAEGDWNGPADPQSVASDWDDSVRQYRAEQELYED